MDVSKGIQMKKGKTLLLSLIAVMAAVSLAVAGTSLVMLYQAGLEQNGVRLRELAHGFAHELRVVARSGQDIDQYLRFSRQLMDEHQSDQKAWEVLAARRDGNVIRILYQHRHDDQPAPAEVFVGSALGQPMQRAVAGETGTMIGRDYSGVEVLAAFYYIEELRLGVVAKIDMQELRKPFTRASLFALVGAALLAVIGGLFLKGLTHRLVTTLEQGEERFRALAECSPLGVFETDATGEFFYANSKLRSLVSAPGSVFTLAWVAERVHPDERESVLAGWRNAIAQNGDWFCECRLCNAQGEVRWVRIQAASMSARSSRSGYVGTVEDITEQKKTQEQSALLARIVEQNHETVIITDTQGTIQYVNAAFERATGYSKQEALGQNPRLLKSGQHRPEFYNQLWSALLQGEEWTGRLFNKRRDGGLLVEDAVLFPIRDAHNRTTNFVGIKRDVTQQHQMAEQLRHAQKMEAVGRLAGGVAHDFNNLLGVILGYADLTLDRLSSEDPLRGKITEIRKAGERAAALTRQLLAFSRRQVLQPEPLNLNTVLQDVHKMLGRLIGEDIELIIQPAGDLGLVTADRGQIEQVIMNLAVNARDAMPQGGKLVLQTANVTLDDLCAAERRTGKCGPHVLLTVTDTGHGMDRETQARLFEPFFTTKEVGKGTGLGLATVYGIVKQSGGSIWVYSEVDKGTTFKIYLPRTDSAVKTAEHRGTGQSAANGNETVLLVEDSDPLRGLIREGLESAGYTVLEAGSAAVARQLCRAHPGPIHIMLSDVVMPQTGGRELAEELRPLRPQMRVIFMSGYTSDATFGQSLEDGQVAFIQKPFNLADLLQTIRSVLHPPRREQVVQTGTVTPNPQDECSEVSA
jgi:PAS domain S-box-containing protein